MDVQSPASSNISTLKTDVLIQAFIKIRDKRAELKAIYEAENAKWGQKLQTLETEFMRRLNEDGVESYKTQFGIAFLQREYRAQCNDWPAFWTWCRDNDRLDLLEKRVVTSGIRLLVEDNVSLPPGVALNVERVVRVRK